MSLALVYWLGTIIGFVIGAIWAFGRGRRVGGAETALAFLAVPGVQACVDKELSEEIKRLRETFQRYAEGSREPSDADEDTGNGL